MNQRRRLTPLLLAASIALTAGAALAYDTGEVVKGFKGTDESGQSRDLSAYKGKVVVVVVWSSKCPTCKAYGPTLERLSKSYSGKAVFLGVAPNTGETPETVTAGKKSGGVSFPVIIDGGGSIARGLGAAMTPTVLVIDAEGKLRYQGAVADKPRSGKQSYLADALAAVVAGRAPPIAKTRVIGFRIK